MKEASPPTAFTFFAIRPTVSPCDLSGVVLHQKWISLFYQKFDVDYFFIQQFFRKKKLYFQTKLQKTVLGAHLTISLGKKASSPKINITFFILNEVLNILLFTNFFQKMCNFLRKRQKTVFVAQVSFEGKEASGDENEYNLFLWKMRSRIFYRLTIFSKKAIFLETGKKFLGWGDTIIF